MRPLVLLLIPIDAPSRHTLAAQFDLIDARDNAALDQACTAHGDRISIVLTTGTAGLSAAQMDRLPKLTLIGALGVGYENIDLAAARTRNITVTNGAGSNDDCVADHALGLLLAVVRDIPALDRSTRAGIWRDALPPRPNVSGKAMGIVGYGHIGRKVAQRARAFNMAIAYHSRNRQADSDDRYFDSVAALAQWADYLVVTTPGGAATRHLINGEVLAALGPAAYLVNVARGSVVDTAALADALQHGALAGAALDVYEGEPAPPAALLGCERVVLTPHVAGRSPEAVANSIALFIDNVTRHLAGSPVATPV